MKDDIPDKLTENGDAGAVSDDFIDELINVGRHHFATDFPNPQRIDCPAPETYSVLISQKKLPGEQLQTHLQSCSECFRVYRSLLEAQRKTVVLKPDWTQPVPWYRRVLSVGLPIVLVSFALYGLYSLYQTMRHRSEQGSASSQPQQSAATRLNGEVPPSSNQNDRASVEPRKKTSPGPINSPSRNMIGAHRVTINFGKQTVSRSASRSEIPPVTFLAGLNQLTISLSPESPRGEYKLTLNDPFGKEVRPPVVGTFDGKVLRAELDLNLVAPGNYLICIARAAEIPDCRPALVKGR